VSGWSLAFPYPITEGLPVIREEPLTDRIADFPEVDFWTGIISG
jgi:hypothetical protein